MRVIVLSDLHIGSKDTPESLSWVSHLCSYILSCTYHPTYIFFLGDIVDKGGIAGEMAFRAANDVFSFIEKTLEHVPFSYMFLPGNHDYSQGTLSLFSDFCKKREARIGTPFDYTRKSTWSLCLEQINFIFTDSIQGGDYSRPGKIRLEDVESCIQPNKSNVLLMHHSLIYEDDSDHSGVVNQADCIDFLEKNKLSFVFHGHVHASRPFDIQGNKLIGIGTIREDIKDTPVNENAQFLELQISGNRIESVDRRQWQGGVERYERIQMYPDTGKQYDNFDSIAQIPYDKPANQIGRLVAPVNEARDAISLAFRPELRKPLQEVFGAHPRILLIGDAGQGKSQELKNLAHLLSENDKYHRSVLLHLNYYSGGTLQEFINHQVPSYQTLAPEKLIVLLDGYEEIPHNANRSFRLALEEYCKNNPDTRICISMRSNYYKENARSFEAFHAYQLLDLQQSDIRKVVEENNLDYEDFYHECKAKNLAELLRNPFYLCSMKHLENMEMAALAG